MDFIQSNILNLTHLWKTVAETFNAYSGDETLGYCYTEDFEWPNKVWLKSNPNEAALKDVYELMVKSQSKLTFSFFDLDIEGKNETIERAGFDEKSVQYGMSLELKDTFKTHKVLKFELVTEPEAARIWSNTFHSSFGYYINEETLKRTFERVNYFLIYDNNTLVGTVIKHDTSSTIGIHSLGIIPEMRGRGYATEIMHHILNESIEKGLKLVTLQASLMAKSMYEKMGFKTQFIMRNYKLKF